MYLYISFSISRSLCLVMYFVLYTNKGLNDSLFDVQILVYFKKSVFSHVFCFVD